MFDQSLVCLPAQRNWLLSDRAVIMLSLRKQDFHSVFLSCWLYRTHKQAENKGIKVLMWLSFN